MKADKQPKVKLSFSRVAVILMYVMVIGFFAFIAITSTYPPVEFIIAWMGFWCIQAIVTAVLQINKRGYNHKVTLFESLLPYLNEDNVSAVIEKYVGIDPKYKTPKVVNENNKDKDNQSAKKK